MIDVAELYVQRTGRGRPILCMHGGMGFDQSTLRPWLDPLTDAYELIFYDHQGNGRSASPADWSTIDHASWVRDAELLRTRLGLGRVVLFGHSWGGFLAQEYALRHPEALAGLILCSTAPALDYPEQIVANASARGTAEQVAALGRAFSEPQADDAALAELMRTIGSLYFHRPQAAVVHSVFADVRYSAAAFNRALFHCAGTFDTRARLHEVRAPTLLVGGSDDWIMPAAFGIERIAREIPHADVHIINDAGHFPFVEKTDEFIATIRQWLKGLP